ncbi:MAG: hypothetical protein ABWK01_06060 [Infirmifilum sp.]
MTLARIRYLQRQLAKKYGVIGRVASRYLEAGLSVRLNHPTRLGPAHLVVQGNGKKLLVEVYNNPTPLKPEDVRRVAEKARLLRATPVIVVYGERRRRQLTPEAKAEAASLKVKIKYISSSMRLREAKSS